MAKKTKSWLLRSFWVGWVSFALLNGWLPAQAGLLSAASRPLSLLQAQAAAQQVLQEQAAGGRTPAWQEASLAAGQPIQDLHGHTTAYLFPVQAGRVAAGYIVVSGKNNAPRVVEFSPSAINPLQDGLGRARQAARQAGLSVRSAQPLYLDSLGYVYEVSPLPQGGRRFFDLRTEQVIPFSAAQLTAVQTPFPVSYPISPRTDVFQGYQRIEGVPDFRQYPVGECLSGCFPTSIAQVYAFWDRLPEYNHLIEASQWQAAVEVIRSDVGTHCEAGVGITSVSDRYVPLFAQKRGYHGFSARFEADPGFTQAQAELDAGRPVILNFGGWYGGHSVVGIGYDRGNLIVLDNSAKGSAEIYLPYDRWQYYGLVKICPPGISCGGDSGLYTGSAPAP